MKENMQRNVIRTDGTSEVVEVGNGWESWNKILGIHTGTIAYSQDGTIELWCDDEGLLKGEPELNMAASMLVGQHIVGDVIVFYPGDIL